MSIRNNIVITLCLLCSLAVHLFSAFLFSPRIDSRSAPVISGWIGILRKDDLSSNSGSVNFPLGVEISSPGYLRAKYLLPLPSPRKFTAGQEEFTPDIHDKTIKNVSSEDEQDAYFYLWKKRVPVYHPLQEDVSYNAYVSPRGAIVFLYPDRLPADSRRALRSQHYIRNSAYFMSDRFFWTKIEGIVK